MWLCFLFPSVRWARTAPVAYKGDQIKKQQVHTEANTVINVKRAAK